MISASGGPSILKELSNEQTAVDLEDAARMNVHAVAVQAFIGGEFETQSIANLTKLVDAGYRCRHTGPRSHRRRQGPSARRALSRSRHRICAELGAQIVKTYYCETGFEHVTAGCPVPVVMAGGKKLPELDALTMAYRGNSRRRGRGRHGAETSSSRTPPSR